MNVNEVLSQLLLLVPTVGIAAVTIRMVVEFCKKEGWVAEDAAAVWSLAGNGIAYALLMAASHFGYASQVEEAFTWVNSHVNELAALLSLVALVLGSTGATKLVHEVLKKLSPWWDTLGTKG